MRFKQFEKGSGVGLFGERGVSKLICGHCMSYLCAFKRSLLGVKICLSHAQIGLL